MVSKLSKTRDGHLPIKHLMSQAFLLQINRHILYCRYSNRWLLHDPKCPLRKRCKVELLRTRCPRYISGAGV